MNTYRFSVSHVKPLGPSRPDPERLNNLWEQWLAARTLAIETGKLADGIEAGHRWRDFLAAYVASPPLAPAE